MILVLIVACRDNHVLGSMLIPNDYDMLGITREVERSGFKPMGYRTKFYELPYALPDNVLPYAFMQVNPTDYLRLEVE